MTKSMLQTQLHSGLDEFHLSRKISELANQLIQTLSEQPSSPLKPIANQAFITQVNKNIPNPKISSDDSLNLESLKKKILLTVQKIVSADLAKNLNQSTCLLLLADVPAVLDYAPVHLLCLELVVDEYQIHPNLAAQALIKISEFHEKNSHHLLAVETLLRMRELKISPHIALNRIGLLFMKLCEYEQAMIYFSLASKETPNYSTAWLNAGVAAQHIKRFSHAAQCLEKAKSLEPNNPDIYYNLGIIYYSINDWHSCSKNLALALYFDPEWVDALYNYGVLFAAMKDFEQALYFYKLAIVLNPQYLLAYYNCGVCEFEKLNYLAAIHYYDKSMRIDENDVRSHWNAAHCELILGNYDAGLPLYEWRWQHNALQNNQKQRFFEQPLWTGEAVQIEQTILLHAEQGFGDTLQFIRFVHTVLNLKKFRVILEVQSALTTLVKSSFPQLAVFARGEKLPEFDLHCPLMSLPIALGVKLKDSNEYTSTRAEQKASYPRISPQTTLIGTYPLPQVPYLSVESSLRSRWDQRLQEFLPSKPIHQRLRVGLVWSSGYRQDQKDTWERNKERNIDLMNLSGLASLPIDWVSLQLGEIPLKELADTHSRGPLGSKVLDLSPHIKDFADTASIAHHLDLVLSVDTSVAHLCAALGIKTWVLLKANACWRWHLDTEYSPWYPGLRLYRQKVQGDWQSVVQKVYLDLQIEFGI